MMGYHIL
ncbi:hypothetical protein Pint_19995 [Pistacia integerrima]|nr:hypothetical protein Pint_19995 [Pistacia integerrima]